MTGWQCPICLTTCSEVDLACPSCETPKPGLEKGPPLSDQPTFTFGAGPAVSSSQFITRTPILNQTPTFGNSISFGVSGEYTAPSVVCQPIYEASRLSFGQGNQVVGSNTGTPSPENTPSAYCRAVATPPKNDAGLLNIPDDFTTDDLDPISEEGVIYTWGSGECDQLAVRNDAMDADHCRSTPILVKRLSIVSNQVESIVCGSMISFAIMHEGGRLWSWGCADHGPLGRPLKGADLNQNGWGEAKRPAQETELFAARVPAPVWNLPESERITKISCGDSHAVAITEGGDCYCWGSYRDYTGPLGFFSPESERVIDAQWVPVKMPLEGVALECASGENHTVILCSFNGENILYVWGSSEFGQIAQPPQPLEDRKRYLKPKRFYLKELKLHRRAKLDLETQQAGQLLHVAAGSCTTFLTVYCKGSTTIFAFGRNAYGELGTGVVSQETIDPVEVKLPPLLSLVDIQGGDQVTIGLTSDGSVWSWGRRAWTGLGYSPSDDFLGPITTPALVHGLRNRVHSIACGSKTCYAVTRAGQLFVWGEGHSYQFGNGQAVDHADKPTYVPFNFPQQLLRRVTAGAQHCVALACPIDNVALARVRPVKRRREEDEELDKDVREVPELLHHDDDDDTSAPKKRKVETYPSFGPGSHTVAVPSGSSKSSSEIQTPVRMTREVPGQMEQPNIVERDPTQEMSVEKKTPPRIREPEADPKSPLQENSDSGLEEERDERILVTPSVELPVPSQGEAEPEEKGEETPAAVEDDIPGETSARVVADASENEEIVEKKKIGAKAKGKAKAKAKAKAKGKAKAKATTVTTRRRAAANKEEEEEAPSKPATRKRAVTKRNG